MNDGPTTIVGVCLDESGSMQSRRNDTVGGLNAYLGTLRELPGRTLFTLVKFDSDGNNQPRLTRSYTSTPIDMVRDLGDATYRPCGGTPLYDAAHATISALDIAAATCPGAKVICAIVTDGEENASKVHTKATLKAAIETRQAMGWVFTFLGTGIDAYAEAGSLGIGRGQTVRFGACNTVEAMAATANATRLYASGASATYTISDLDKKKAGDPTAA